MSYTGTYEKDQTLTLASGETITGYQVVIPNTSPTQPDDLECKVADGGITVPLGVAQVDDNSSIVAGNPIAVRMWGVTKAIAAKAINPGDLLAPTSTGHVTNTVPAAGTWFVGIALTKASQLGDEILMLIKQEVNEA